VEKELLDGFKIVFGAAILILGMLMFFDSEVFLEASLSLLQNPYANYDKTLENVLLFKKVHTYSTILIAIGVLMTADGLLRSCMRQLSKTQ
jgi:hypothetical protein